MESVITSVANPTIKRIRRLSTSSKARREEGAYIAEGIHLVKSFLSTGQLPLEYFVAESALGSAEVAELHSKLSESGAKKVIVADSLFESITSIHAGVGIAIVFKPDTPTLERPLSRSAVILDDIQDPGNIGTILRTAAAAGVGDIVVASGSASAWSPRALRAGMGAQFSLNIHEVADLLPIVHQSMVPVMTTTLAADSQPLYSLDLTGETAWVFGNEGQGVKKELAAAADVRVSIPQSSSAVESLNVSAAAAICLYEQYRQNIT